MGLPRNRSPMRELRGSEFARELCEPWLETHHSLGYRKGRKSDLAVAKHVGSDRLHQEFELQNTSPALLSDHGHGPQPQSPEPRP